MLFRSSLAQRREFGTEPGLESEFAFDAEEPLLDLGKGGTEVRVHARRVLAEVEEVRDLGVLGVTLAG